MPCIGSVVGQRETPTRIGLPIQRAIPRVIRLPYLNVKVTICMGLIIRITRILPLERYRTIAQATPMTRSYQRWDVRWTITADTSSRYHRAYILASLIRECRSIDRAIHDQ